MSVVSIKIDGNGNIGSARYLTLRLIGLLQAAGFPCNAGLEQIDVIVSSEKSRTCAEPVNSLDVMAQGLVNLAAHFNGLEVGARNILAGIEALTEEAKAIRKAVTPVDTVVAVEVAAFKEPCGNSLVGRLRKLAHKVRNSGADLDTSTYALACSLAEADKYKGGALPPTIQVLAQSMATECGSGRVTAELYDLAGQFLGATGGAYRG